MREGKASWCGRWLLLPLIDLPLLTISQHATLPLPTTTTITYMPHLGTILLTYIPAALFVLRDTFDD